MVKRSVIFIIIGTLVILVGFIIYVLFFKSEAIKQKTSNNLGPEAYFYGNEIKYSWDKSQMGWNSGESGDVNAELVSDYISIEFNQELCKREINRVCGFSEAGGTFKDVAETVTYALSILDGNVRVNMKLNSNNTYLPLAPFATEVQSFNNNIPVRIIYDDGDKYTFPVRSEGFSRGWGVDPNTNGLILFLATTKEQVGNNISIDLMIYEALNIVTNSQEGTTVINEQQRNTLGSLWFKDDSERTLKIIQK